MAFDDSANEPLAGGGAGKPVGKFRGTRGGLVGGGGSGRSRCNSRAKAIDHVLAAAAAVPAPKKNLDDFWAALFIDSISSTSCVRFVKQCQCGSSCSSCGGCISAVEPYRALHQAVGTICSCCT